MIEGININYCKGDTYQFDLTISGYDQTIDSIFFTIKNNENDKRHILRKTLEEGITLMDDTNGVKTYKIEINANDTDNLKTNYEYYFAIKIFTEKGTNDLEKTIVKGLISLSARGD